MDLRDSAAKLNELVIVRSRVLVARLRRTTPRERLLLGGLVAGVIVWAPVAALDWRAQQEERYLQALTEVTSAKLGLDAARRVTATADERALADMRQWGFKATNVAVAGVLIEQRLVDAARDAGLTNARVDMGDSLSEEDGPVKWLDAEIQADLVWSGVFGLLNSVAEWPEGFRVTRFRYERRNLPEGMVPYAGGPPVGSVQIELAFPVEVEQTLDEAEPTSRAAGAARS